MKLWWCFVISWIFLQCFLEFSITGRVGIHKNDFLFFFSFFLSLSCPILAWKETMMVFSNFLNFFTIFLEFSIMGRDGTHPNFFFLFSPFLGLSQPILAWNEAMMVFCNFLNFLAIFLEFSIPSRVGTHRNYFFFNFLSFSAFRNLFRLEKKLWWCFQIFWIFSLFFRIFYYGSRRHTSERFFLFSLFHDISHRILAWKEAMMVFSNFLNFFCYLFEIFYYGLGRRKSEWFFFIFSLSRPFQTYFGLKRSYDSVF